MSQWPDLNEEKAIEEASGDQDGSISSAGSVVTRLGIPPETGTVKMS